MFDTGNHGNAAQQLLKQFVIIKENKILFSLELERNTIFAKVGIKFSLRQVFIKVDINF